MKYCDRQKRLRYENNPGAKTLFVSENLPLNPPDITRYISLMRFKLVGQGFLAVKVECFF